MAYADSNRTGNRGATITVVALLHLGLGYALISGFGAMVIRTLTHPNPSATFTLDPPPPPPKPDPTVEPNRDTKMRDANNPPTAPKPALDLTQSPTQVPVTDNIPLPVPVPTFAADPYLPPLPPTVPSPSPSFTPKGAVPVGNPGGWATTRDYPSRDLREGNEGIASFRLTIGIDGRVQDCRIVGTSGHKGLDEATCKNVSKRARFEPARDRNGAKITGSYTNAIRWIIPE